MTENLLDLILFTLLGGAVLATVAHACLQAWSKPRQFWNIEEGLRAAMFALWIAAALVFAILFIVDKGGGCDINSMTETEYEDCVDAAHAFQDRP